MLETLERYIVCLSLRVRPVVIVVLCPSVRLVVRPIVRPVVVVLCPSIRPAVRSVVVVRPSVPSSVWCFSLHVSSVAEHTSERKKGNPREPNPRELIKLTRRQDMNTCSRFGHPQLFTNQHIRHGYASTCIATRKAAKFFTSHHQVIAKPHDRTNSSVKSTTRWQPGHHPAPFQCEARAKGRNSWQPGYH